MTVFDFYVYNKRTGRNHYQFRSYETNDKEKAKELFLNEPESWRYDILSVEIHIPKETFIYEGDFTSNEISKRTIIV